MKWTVGLTTCDRRANEPILTRTLNSLDAAGFPPPRIFADAVPHDAAATLQRSLGLEVTSRYPRARAFANFRLGLQELYERDPAADRYVMAQDDFVAYRNLCQYLERTPYPMRSYLNCYLFPSGEDFLAKQGRKSVGWHPSNQLGKGAVLLVFDLAAVQTLLSQRHLIDRVTDPIRGWRSLDGAVVEAMKIAGWQEHVHYPSLVQHTGEVSSIDKRKRVTGHDENFDAWRWPEHTFASTFRGEDFDALALLPEALCAPSVM